MNVFEYRKRLIDAYASYIQSFIAIRDQRIADFVEERLSEGELWPEPLIQLNPSFEPGETIDQLVQQNVLHPECARIFRVAKDDPAAAGPGRPMRLHRHQADAVRTAKGGHNYVLTTGTGSGKSLAYIVPIVDHLLRRGSGRGIQAIIVYPMNALANSQEGELRKFLHLGYPEGKPPVTFARYTGQEDDDDRQRIIADPPDILLTNYVMLELLLTRPYEKKLVEAAQGLRFLVLDELHTYRGRQGADVALLVRRTRDALNADYLQCVGTSATLAGVGSYDEQRREIAGVSSLVFGATVAPEHVIGETLRRSTPKRSANDASFLGDLRTRVADETRQPPIDYAGFVTDPLSVWIESTFGLAAEPGSGRLVRAAPRGISGAEGAAAELSRVTGVTLARCVDALQEGLLAGYRCEPDPETGFPPFAFRLHQFISRGDAAYASLEPEERRYITLHGQQFVPGDRSTILLPLVFCRECGQEYFSVWSTTGLASGERAFTQRELSDLQGESGSEPGFLHLSTSEPWPDLPEEFVSRLPEDWVEDRAGSLVPRRDRRKDLPQAVRVGSDGATRDDGLLCHYLRAPFRFCLTCGVEYAPRQTDFAKLSTLSSEGRSTATTILSLFAIQGLQQEATLPENAKKLLSFTDNRQDASLQAGHFNDFVEIGLLRAALYRAAHDAGVDGVEHDQLTQRVFDALDLPKELYAADPTVRFGAEQDTKRALREVLGYRLYRDLKRGWRITSPNLEQCGLLAIQYRSLEDLCAAEDVWQGSHPALVSATPQTRYRVAKVLLDFMRRELSIKVDYLEQTYQERIQQQSSQRLRQPWSIDENELMEHAAVLLPRAARPADYRGHTYLSGRSRFGQFLRRPATFPDIEKRPTVAESETIIRDVLSALRVAGLVEVVSEPHDADDVPGYQIPASALLWTAGDGLQAFHDPLRTPNVSGEGGRTNRFFVDFYRSIAGTLQGYEAREHTAQVPYDKREQREQDFRDGKLPILYCSPTMELGVDISELNVVNLRNVPPTPANYAQRSGRAGRSGQPALVFSYCSTARSHDQYFFRRPERMVAGAVTPPRLDLANEDLVRAHIHAIWLAETELSLGNSLRDILDLSGDRPSLELLDWVRQTIADEQPRQRAKQRAGRVLTTLQSELVGADWWSEGWLDETLAHIALRFNRACDRWRSLYRSAFIQAEMQGRIIRDASRSQEDKRQAARLRAEAEAQLRLLTQEENVRQSDFYSYRYFASEGFLPGYSFPRLPLSAYIPGRRGRQDEPEFVQRPRFLAISEFGPRGVIYHEGSRYIINKVILPVPEEASDEGDGRVVLGRAKQCERCGYLHRTSEVGGADVCEQCGFHLPLPLTQLFRLQNVSTKRRDRITSDEEERMRLGFELRTGLRFAAPGGRPSRRQASLERDGDVLARLTYGHAATLWRINLGWRRRRNQAQQGFVLDIERGYWATNDQAPDPDGDDGDSLSQRTARVIPYVEDRRNCLLVAPSEPLETAAMASLQAALKNAIQVVYQLEDNELAAEPLPFETDRRLLLFYESAEGGAGVLRRLLDDPAAFARVAREALSICHFDPDTGEDLHRGPRAREDCEAACYDCLMSYTNQRDHALLDRRAIQNLLFRYAQAHVVASPVELPRAEHLANLLNRADSELERRWLQFIDERAFPLPSASQVRIERCGTRPDFLYEEHVTAVYVDGPVHDFPDRQARDREAMERMADAGYTVIRFGHQDDWPAIVAGFPSIFAAQDGEQRAAAAPSAPSAARASLPDLDLFDPRWHELILVLAQRDDLTVEEGGDIAGTQGTVIGRYEAEVVRGGRRVRLLADGDSAVDATVSSDGAVRYMRVEPAPVEGAIAAILASLESAS